MLKQLYDWIGKQVHTRYADALLILLSIFESILFPPVAPVLVLYCIENRKKSYIYATIATVFSVLGGVISYFIGYALWQTVGQTLITWVTSPEKFNDIVAMYQCYESVAILIGSFSPLPYKALSLTAGFCKLSLSSFIIYSLIGRGIRYYLIALVLYIWGPGIKEFIDRWFYQLVVLFFVLMSCSILVLLA